MSNEAEASVISVLLRDNSKIQSIGLMPKHFQNATYAHIFDVIKRMLSARQVVDIISLAEELGIERDWLTFLSNIMTSGCCSVDNVGAYAELIERGYVRRQAIAIADKLKSSEGASEAVSDAIRGLMSLGSSESNYEYDLKGVMQAGLAAIDKAFKNKGSLLGVDTGLTSLNEILGGFHAGDLVIVGARPAMGKTSILLNMLMGANEAVGCFSGEQGVMQISQRLISIKSKVSLMNMRNGNLDDADFNNLNAGGHTICRHKGFWIYDKSSPSIEDVERMARKWKFEHGIKALYVDYLQKIKRDSSKNKAEAIGDNAARLKDLARELEIPIICLAQVKRDVETRQNKRPLMGDLSDSSETEKEADQIIMLYRDEVYNPDSNDKGVMELLVEKNRHGATGRCFAKWDGRYLEVSDLSHAQRN